MSAPVLPTLYCAQADVENLLSVLGVKLRLDHDGNGTVDATEQQSMTLALNWASDDVNLYCTPLYDVTALATSVQVNRWATVLAAQTLCELRTNPVPDSLNSMVNGPEGSPERGVLGRLEAVLAKRLQIPGIAYRYDDSPQWSNLTVDPRYAVNQIRVQRNTSYRRAPAQYTQRFDLWAEYVGTAEY